MTYFATNNIGNKLDIDTSCGYIQNSGCHDRQCVGSENSPYKF